MPNVFVVGVSGVFSLVGAFVTISSLRSLKESIKLRRTDTTPIRDVSPDADSFVEVEGTATPADDGTLDGKLVDAEGVVRHFSAERREHDDEGATWEKRRHVVESVPFYVEDGSGARARIDVPDLDPDRRHTHGMNANFTSLVLDRQRKDTMKEATNEELTEFFDTSDDVTGGERSADDDAEGLPPNDHRVTEGLVEVGGVCYVAGVPERAPDDPDADVVIGPGDRPEKMVVANQSEAEVEAGTVLRAVAGTVLGLALTAPSAWGVYVGVAG